MSDIDTLNASVSDTDNSLSSYEVSVSRSYSYLRDSIHSQDPSPEASGTSTTRSSDTKHAPRHVDIDAKIVRTAVKLWVKFDKRMFGVRLTFAQVYGELYDMDDLRKEVYSSARKIKSECFILCHTTAASVIPYNMYYNVCVYECERNVCSTVVIMFTNGLNTHMQNQKFITVNSRFCTNATR